MTPAELVVTTRRELGLSQRQLALRAGMTQAGGQPDRARQGLAVVHDVRELMVAMGRQPTLSSIRLPTGWDPAHMRSTLARPPEERMRLALGWNRLAARLAAAGPSARSDE